MKRPDWDTYFLDLAKQAGTRATCNRGRSACVFVRDNIPLMTGYVGSVSGEPHCDDVGHKIKKVIHEDGRVTEHCVRTTHAEQNAVALAAKLGVSLDKSTLYCNMVPCLTCANLIIRAGIIRVVCQNKYHAGKDTEELFRKVGIKLKIVNKGNQKYE